MCVSVTHACLVRSFAFAADACARAGAVVGIPFACAKCSFSTCTYTLAVYRYIHVYSARPATPVHCCDRFQFARKYCKRVRNGLVAFAVRSVRKRANSKTNQPSWIHIATINHNVLLLLLPERRVTRRFCRRQRATHNIYIVTRRANTRGSDGLVPA